MSRFGRFWEYAILNQVHVSFALFVACLFILFHYVSFDRAIFCKVLTLTYFPPVLLFWHRHLHSKQCCCPSWSLREIAVLPEKETDDKVPPEV